MNAKLMSQCVSLRNPPSFYNLLKTVNTCAQPSTQYKRKARGLHCSKSNDLMMMMGLIVATWPEAKQDLADAANLAVCSKQYERIYYKRIKMNGWEL